MQHLWRDAQQELTHSNAAERFLCTSGPGANLPLSALLPSLNLYAEKCRHNIDFVSFSIVYSSPPSPPPSEDQAASLEIPLFFCFCPSWQDFIQHLCADKYSSHRMQFQNHYSIIIRQNCDIMKGCKKTSSSLKENLLMGLTHIK